MDKLILLPDAEGYQSGEPSDTIRIALEGGAGRYREDKVGGTKMVGVAWTMNPSAYQYWRAFYATHKTVPFLCDLVSEDGLGPTEHVCRFVPDSVSLPRQQGFTYVQQAQLEVEPLVHNPEQDASIIAVFVASDGNPDLWLNLLEKLVNVDAPEALHG